MKVMESRVANLEAEALKEQGNQLFKLSDFDKAIDCFTKAIEIDSSNAKYFLNRSLCYGSQGDWSRSGEDARKALRLDPKYSKAHFRLIRALIELKRFNDAKTACLVALKEFGELKEFHQLEQELFDKTKIPLRPRSNDYDIVEELGDGNFSKVFKAVYKSTGLHYAIKVCILYLCGRIDYAVRVVDVVTTAVTDRRR